MLKIEISRDAAKFLKSLPSKQAGQITGKLKGLMADPLPHDSQLLKGYADLRRADAGEYRIIYRVDGDTLEIPLIGKRNDGEVYRRLRRR